MNQTKRNFKKLAIVLGDQLFPDHSKLLNQSDTLVFMAEDYSLCTHYSYHKQKLVLFLSSMRSHADQLRNRYDLVYHKLSSDNKHLSYEEKLNQTLEEYQITELITYQISDHFFKKRLEKFASDHSYTINYVQTPGFLTTEENFKVYLKSVKKPFMASFYQSQRERLDLLMTSSGAPLHGKWSFDEENRKKLPKKIKVPKRNSMEPTAHTKNAQHLVDSLFPDHPGDVQGFNWCTTRQEVLEMLNDFLETKFEQFGPYEDAIEEDQTFLFHSVLSPYINMGLITPSEVVEEVMLFVKRNEVHYSSVEGFIRQVIGWREFVKGIYDHYENDLRSNFFGHERKMKPCWYDGSTGIKPLDDSIKKALTHGYTHHIERLMVLGNLMLLCEIHPDEVNRWFMEMYVDSADWVMVPNVYGMSQFADGGIFATKPYIGGANYILKMSHYSKQEDWVQTVNGLYWRFIDVNRTFFSKNYRMSMMVSMLDKMDKDRKIRLIKQADQFIEAVTEF